MDEWHREIGVGFSVHHGARLLELKLLHFPGEELTEIDLATIASNCQFLRDFTLTLRRSQGDATEVALYKTLGSLPRLQSVTLELDVSKHYDLDDNESDDEGNVFNPSFDDEFDQQVQRVLYEGI